MKLNEILQHIRRPLDQHYTTAAIRDIARALKEDVFDQGMNLDFDEVIEELLEDRPIQYITGVCHFYGQKFVVDERVLVPRPETEELTDWILSHHGDGSKRVMEHGTGSGCMGLILALKRPAWRVHMGDISDEAVAVAKANARQLGIEASIDVIDMTDHLAYMDQYEIITANPPYVRHTDKDIMEPTVLDYEPHLALFAPDQDDLYFYREILTHTAHHQMDCWVYFEHHHELADELAQMMSDMGYTRIEGKQDMQGLDRMTRGRWIAVNSSVSC